MKVNSKPRFEEGSYGAYEGQGVMQAQLTMNIGASERETLPRYYFIFANL